MKALSGKTKTVLSYFFALFGLGLTTITIGPALPGLAAQVGVSISDISVLFTFKELGHLIGALFLVRLLDRYNGNRAVGAFILVIAGLLAVFPFISHLSFLAATIFILGIFASAVDSGTNTLLLWFFKERSPKYLNGLHLMFGIGSLLVPLFFAWVLKATNRMDWVFWGIALILLPGGLFSLTLPAPDNPEHDQTQQKKPPSNKLIFLAAGFFFAYVAAEVAFSGWIYTYSIQKPLADEISSAYLNSAFWGALTIGRLISIPLAAHWTPNKVMRLNFLGALLSFAILIPGQNSFVLVLIGCSLLGLSAASMYPTLMAIANQKMTITARVGGKLIAGASLGAMSLPWLIGQFFERSSPATLFYVIGFLFLLCYGFFRLIIQQDAALQNTNEKFEDVLN